MHVITMDLRAGDLMPGCLKGIKEADEGGIIIGTYYALEGSGHCL